MSDNKGGVPPTLDELADSLPPPLLRLVEALARVIEERDWLARQRRAGSVLGDDPAADGAQDGHDREDDRPGIVSAPRAAGTAGGQVLDDHGGGS